jgi:hypothetical protein
MTAYTLNTSISFFYFNTLYHASFIILYYDQQMHNYFTNYHNPTCFDPIPYPQGACNQYLAKLKNYSNAAVGNTVYT